MSKGIFITATGTDVGKTYVASLIVKKLRDAGLNAGYYKPALSGAEKQPDGSWLPGDAALVVRRAGIPARPEELVSYIYKTAVSPHLAALREGNPPEAATIAADYRRTLRKYDYLTVEGCGGIICPLRWDTARHLLQEEIVSSLGLGTLVISGSGLGSINACALTVFYLQQRGIPVRGIILNNYDGSDFMHTDNRRMIEALTHVPVLAEVAPGAAELAMDVKALLALYE